MFSMERNDRLLENLVKIKQAGRVLAKKLFESRF